MHRLLRNLLVFMAPLSLAAAAAAENKASPSPTPPDTLHKRLMCGYQGWFATPADGPGGWRHYGFGRPGEVHIDMWPDVSELADAELHETPLRLPDGSPARVFSSANPATVRRHFEWMREYGVDGVFLQRFGATLRDPACRAFNDRVLANVRAAAEASGRSWCVMYDLSGLRKGEIREIVMNDWRRLRDEAGVCKSPAYQRHRGRPLVAVWGAGFNDGRAYTLEECGELFAFLRDDPEAGGQSVMAGVPWGWRSLDRDAVRDPALHRALAHADVISPWAVGRYHDGESATRMISDVQPGDLAWCRERGKDYLPVVFPGFSWTNLMRTRGTEAPLDQIPRHGGRFLWRQATERIRGGAEMLYVAMFDEMDEATAIFKTSSTVPALPAGGFVTEPNLPSDHYLWLTGQIGGLLRGERKAADAMPSRK